MQNKDFIAAFCFSLKKITFIRNQTMRNKLLFTTALAGIVLIAADAFAERIEISQDEN